MLKRSFIKLGLGLALMAGCAFLQPAAASAQTMNVHIETVDHHDGRGWDRDRGWDRGRGWDRDHDRRYWRDRGRDWRGYNRYYPGYGSGFGLSFGTGPNYYYTTPNPAYPPAYPAPAYPPANAY